MNRLFIQFNTEMFPEPLPAIVDEAIAPAQSGRVKFEGTYWPAKLHQAAPDTLLLPENAAMVVGIQGITLLVTPP